MPEKKHAIVLMAVGKKFDRVYNRVKKQFEGYAAKCNAALVVCSTPPDPDFKRSLLVQKMLLPYQYRQYDWLAYFDLDVVISQKAPPVFNFIDRDKAFAAVPDPRDSTGFRNVVTHHWKMPHILKETHRTYFTDRGFPDHPSLSASINGGMWLCQPAKIAGLLRDFYFSDFEETPGKASAEEGMMAWVSQTNDLYYPIDGRFNNQVVFSLFEDLENPVSKVIKKPLSRVAAKYEAITQRPFPVYPSSYQRLIALLLKTNYMIHFNGGLPFLKFIE